MMDSVAMLAINLESQPGVYALLLGSGISTAAGVPTGHQVVVDLIRKIAVVHGETCEPDPEKWLADTLGIEPSYSALLEQLAPQPTERRAILRGYFDASPEDVEAGRKVPTRAHRAIARLVASGIVRVILTTNFDRLLEEALHDVGVRPVVISTSEAVHGAPPLTHNECTVVKVHGDYLDTRIKNTVSELASYAPEIDGLIDRVLDEYGLIICGWSAIWDGALRSAIERCPNHRYSTYWALRAEAGPEVDKLMAVRRAVPLQIESADELFERLETAIDGLRTRSPGHLGHELTTAAAVVRELKRSLDDPTRRIALEELIRSETLAVADAISPANFPMDSPQPAIETAAARIRAYEEICSTGIALMATGCFYAQGEQVSLFVDVLDTVANAIPWPSGTSYNMWTNLRYYPALLLMYAGGIGAVAAGREGTLFPLLCRPGVRELPHDAALPLVVGVQPASVMDPVHAKQLPFLKSDRLFVPISEHLLDLLGPPLRDLARTEARYEELFNRYEYLAALLSGDATRDSGMGPYSYIGRFGWVARQPGRPDVGRLVTDEIASQAGDWPLLRAGAFGGTQERVQAAQEVVADAARHLPWH